jgi:hypothetical protein
VSERCDLVATSRVDVPIYHIGAKEQTITALLLRFLALNMLEFYNSSRYSTLLFLLCCPTKVDYSFSPIATPRTIKHLNNTS